jgi:hypothetical protein
VAKTILIEGETGIQIGHRQTQAVDFTEERWA